MADHSVAVGAEKAANAPGVVAVIYVKRSNLLPATDSATVVLFR